MSNSAEGTGQAGPVAAQAGPPLDQAAELALILTEVAAADGTLERMRAKLAKAQVHAEERVAAAQSSVEDAEAGVTAALERAAALLGASVSEADIRSLAARVAQEQQRHREQMDALAAELAGGLAGGED